MRGGLWLIKASISQPEVVAMERKAVVVFIVLVFFVVIGFWFKSCLEIDKCLDSGGCWNYEKKECQYNENCD